MTQKVKLVCYVLLAIAGVWCGVNFVRAYSKVTVARAVESTAESGETATPPPAVAQKAPGKIKLTWTQSTGPGITQNKVYRSTTGPGGPYTLRTTLSATTTYTDTGLTSGASYYYVVTAVNSGGESPFSGYAGATAK